MALHRLEGDPHVVAAEARKMADAARAMIDAAAQLRSLADPGQTVSQAVSAYSENAVQLAGTVTKAHVRYHDSGAALGQYAPVLEEAQRQSEEAVRALAGTDVTGARLSVVAAMAEEHNPVNLLRGPEERAAAQANTAHAQAALAAEQAAVAAAEAQWHAADERLKAAAVAAMAIIEQAIDAVADFNDGFWDNVDGFIDEHLDPILEFIKDKIVPILRPLLEEISDLLDKLAFVLDVLAAVVAIVAVVAAIPTGGASLALLGVAEGIALVSLGVKGLKSEITLARYLLGDVTLEEYLKGQIVLAVEALLVVVGGSAVAKKAGTWMTDRAITTIGRTPAIREKWAGLLVSKPLDLAWTMVKETTHLEESRTQLDVDAPPPYEQMYMGGKAFVEEQTHQDVDPMVGDAASFDVESILADFRASIEDMGTVNVDVTPCTVGR